MLRNYTRRKYYIVLYNDEQRAIKKQLAQYAGSGSLQVVTGAVEGSIHNDTCWASCVDMMNTNSSRDEDSRKKLKSTHFQFKVY